MPGADAMPEEYVITLVAPDDARELLPETLRDFEAQAANRDPAIALSPGEAVEFHARFASDEALGYREFLRLRMRGLPLDWCMQPAARQRKRMLIADMDSTIIAQECLDELADLKGLKPEIAAITERAMRGELDFEAALRERIAMLAGLTEREMRDLLDERITLNPGARTLVRTMASRGAHTLLVSGGFTLFTEEVARRAGFAAHRANTFIWADGRLAGVAEPVLGREAKREALEQEAGARGLTAADVIAVGDGANDLAMLKAAGLGVAYRAKPVIAAEADAQVNHTSLTTLLFFQGYARSDFIE
jgi:phosphoserine phosphatase